MRRKLLAGVILGLLALSVPAGATSWNTTTTTTEATTTTTDPVESTTTTALSTTSSTENASTTTTETGSTTTTSGLLLAGWTASSTCDRLTAEWGDGISSVYVWWRDPVLGDFQLELITESGQTLWTGVAAEFILIPVPVNGWTAVPDEIHLFTEVCENTTTTTVPATTTADQGSTLPFTGLSDNMWATLVFAGFVSAVLGWVFVMSSRDDE